MYAGRLSVLLLCLTFAGCGLFPKSESNSAQGLTGDRLPPAGNSVTSSRNGVLAGQVVDIYSQRRAGVSLTIQPQDGGEPVSAITNDQGYFTVNNLQSGKRYKVLARATSGNVTSTGSTEATASNVVVLIKLNDSKTETDGKSMGMSGSIGGRHSSIAGPDDTAQWSRGNPAATGRGDRLGAAPDVNTPPANANNNVMPTVNPRLGRAVTSDTPPASTGNVPVRPEYVAENESNQPRTRLPYMNINGPANSTPGEASRSASSSFFDVPLLDLDNRQTTLNSYRGKLTLVDLWNTDCVPCLQAMPELMKVQRAYQSQGLVVVGIAINEKSRPEDNAAKIRWRTGQKGVDYPLLMEQPSRSIAQLFKVDQVPTMILLDESGREVWRNVGFNPDTRKALDQELQKRLR